MKTNLSPFNYSQITCNKFTAATLSELITTAALAAAQGPEPEAHKNLFVTIYRQAVQEKDKKVVSPPGGDKKVVSSQ